MKHLVRSLRKKVEFGFSVKKDTSKAWEKQDIMPDDRQIYIP